MKAVVNGVTYADWQVSFDGKTYKILGCTSKGGPMVLLKDYGTNSGLAYIDFEEITSKALIGEEVTI